MIRLFIAFLSALALALSPVAASAAAASPNAMPGCTMKGEMPSKPADHAKMDCCTPACQAPAGAALLQDRNGTSDTITADRDLHSRERVKKLISLSTTGLDPPPRLHS